MKTKELETLLIIILGLIVLSLYLGQPSILYACLLVGFTCLLFPTILRYVHLFWIAIGNKLGIVSALFILTIVYFIILIPISLLYKVFNKDPLRLLNGYNSYWHKCHKKYSENDFLNPW